MVGWVLVKVGLPRKAASPREIISLSSHDKSLVSAGTEGKLLPQSKIVSKCLGASKLPASSESIQLSP